METNAIEKKSGWPSLLDTGWMEKAFNSPLDAYFNFSKTLNVPSTNIVETENSYELRIATPGLDKQDMNMEISDGILSISAEKTNEEKEDIRNGRFNRMEYNYTSWNRSFTIPKDCDSSKITAEYRNGELRVNIPKKEAGITKTAKKNDIS